MSAIPKDAADIPTDHLPHPTGAATVINIDSVTSSAATTPNPTAPALTVSSSPFATSSSAASPSRPASRDSELPPPRDSQLPPHRDFSLEQHQAEYRAHAFLANESIVATKLAADKFLQNLFKIQNEPDKDILRAASAASRARLQNPFAYNNSRSSGTSSGSSGYSSNSSSSSGSSGSSSSSHPRSSSVSSISSSNPSTPSAPAAPRTTAAQSNPPAPESPSTSPQQAAPSDLAISQFDHLTISPPAPAPVTPVPANANPAADQPLTEADFTDCIRLEDAISNIESTAPRTTAILGGVLVNSTPTATPDAKTPPRMAVPRPAAAQTNPVTPKSTKSAPPPAAASDLAFWPFGNFAISPPPPPRLNLATWPFDHCTISPCNTSWPHGP